MADASCLVVDWHGTHIDALNCPVADHGQVTLLDNSTLLAGYKWHDN